MDCMGNENNKLTMDTSGRKGLAVCNIYREDSIKWYFQPTGKYGSLNKHGIFVEDERAEAINIIRELLDEAKLILADSGGCDHSVGLCACGLIEKIERAEDYLKCYID